MGGGYYDYDVAQQTRSTSGTNFSIHQYVAANDPSQRREVHPSLNIHGRIRECLNQTAVVVAMDVTRSRGQDTRIMYEKLPTLMGQIEVKNYVQGVAISFAAIGDASSGDQAPIQVGQFEADNRLDEVLSHFWIEEGGGGTGQESYELMAHYYAHFTRLACVEQGRKGFFFFIGDEGFYPQVRADQIRSLLGQPADQDVDAAASFRALQEKFEVFFIYPRKSFEQRKQDIDAEIKQRVEAAGGQYEGVDVRASLIWNNTNDLDLHMVTPSGEHIFFNHKQSRCKGWLDVDMNVRGESIKPVENIRWKKGEAPAGTYTIYVQNFRFYEADKAPTTFRVELEVNGQISHFDGVISPHQETQAASNVTVTQFTYDPSQRPAQKSQEEQYAGYQDELILEQWASVLPREHILLIDSPHSIVDVVLGALAISSGTTDLEGYLDDLQAREHTPARRADTTRALQGLKSRQVEIPALSLASLPSAQQARKRGGSSTRL